MKNRELSNVELLALSTFKLSEHDHIRAKVKPGDYPIDINVNFQGAVRVSEDYEAHQPVSCPTTLAILMLILETQGDEAAILQKFVKLNLPKYLSKAANLAQSKADAVLIDFGVPQAEEIYSDKVKAHVGKKIRKGPVVTSLVIQSD